MKNEKIKELLERGVENVVVAKELEKKLKSGKKLRIKHGVDPTTKDLHIGYAVVYNKLKEFQDLGHTIIFLIGDFTARFGDPSDKEKSRQLRSKKEVRDLAKDYIKQLGTILDIKKTEIRYNSEWYDKMSAEELLRLMSHFTNQQMLERDMFKKRLKSGEEIGLHEPVYPVLQGYDSVMLQSDFTVIGNDQTFNELKARDLQKDFGQIPQDVMSMKMLVGTDGKIKMSQSLGNYIGMSESPRDQYGKIMSIPDEAMIHYFTLATKVSDKEIKKIESDLKKGVNPRDIKMRLAREVVTLYHSKKEAEKAEEAFVNQFSKRELPEKIKEFKFSGGDWKLADIISDMGLTESKTEARRLIEQNAVKVDGAVISDREAVVGLKTGMVIQVGKRRFGKIKVTK
ncbi:tyrosine--tRNA ligase [bacterium (Candidatus Howlettbacteria) CG_4_10_14_0_8_um_filter_40_9]|nr:MAG: tyrosine--tRNA ligase [bacterium (Candidatus Howlettbacteria) CG_4_10_14_0_8_um_filter_40_9]